MILNNRWALALIVVFGVPAVLVGYVALVEWFLGLLPYKARTAIRPWFWIGPAVVLLGLFLVYPSINTIYLSVLGPNSKKFVGVANYLYFFTNSGTLESLRNNALWLVLLTAFTVGFGMLFAVLFDRVKYEATAKSIIFLPMAVSFVAASVIWKLQYDYQPAGAAQTGTLNQLVTLLGAQPIPWLIKPLVNTLALIVVGIWTWTGFGLVVLSAGLKGIPVEILEAARVDGADEWQILFRITIPMMASTIAVVATTMIIFALKAFDIVYVLTSGFFGTNVMANQMYQEMFTYNNFGHAAAVAVVLLAAIVPVMAININRFRAQEAIR